MRGLLSASSSLLVAVSVVGLVACGGGGGGSKRGFSQGTAVKFRSRTDVAIQGTGSADLSLADFDGDGDLDVVSANIDLRLPPVADGIEVLRNDSGTLVSVQLLNGCSLPFDVETLDLDGDGAIDIVGSCRSDGIVRVWFGDGSGNFPTASVPVVDLGSGPGGTVESHGFDGDGDGVLDLACIEIVTSRLFFVRGLGSRTFDVPQPISAGAFSDARQSSIDVGDVDGDGDVDIVAADFSGARMLIYLNDGAGVFTATSTVPVADGPVSTRLEDRDGDGDLDLLVGHFTSRSIVIWDNVGDGSFTDRREIVTDSPVTDLILADWNDDGRGDLFAASFDNSSVDVYLAEGDAYGTASGFGVGFHVRRISTGDIDQDGSLDLMTANFEEAALSLVERDDDGAPSAPATVPAGPFPFYFVVDDLVRPNGNELAATLYAEGVIAFFTITKAGVLEAAGELPVPAPIRPNFIVTIDVDDDGDLDLAVTDAEGTDLVIAFNDGVLPFTRLSTQRTSGFQMLGAAAGDLDGDDDQDLLVASQGNDLILVFLNDGAGNFIEASPLPAGVDPSAIALADFDNDGDLDAAVSDSGDDRVTFFSNDGQGLLQFEARSATGSGPTFLAVGDVESDGRTDLFVACPGTDTLTRLRNQGNFTFARSELFVGAGTNFIDLQDADRDGDLDLLTIPKDGQGRLLLNDGTGNFVSREDLNFVTVRDVSCAVLRDINQDRGLDLITASYESSRLQVALGEPVR